MTAPLLFPVGHYLGSVYSAGGTTPDYQTVRVGWRLRRLERADAFAVWALAHGVPDGDDTPAWTRAATEGAVRASGVRDVASVMDQLADLDLLVEVETSREDAHDFARMYRLRSLLTGIGESPDIPNRYGIGYAGQSIVRVDHFTYELWKWAPSCDSLWHACEIFARAERSDVESVLERALAAIQNLVSHGVAYLDETRESWMDVETEFGAAAQ